MHFQSLNISNFRGIRTAKFSNFADINIFLGENNSCKTSALEALFLSVGISNARLLIHPFARNATQETNNALGDGSPFATDISSIQESIGGVEMVFQVENQKGRSRIRHEGRTIHFDKENGYEEKWMGVFITPNNPIGMKDRLEKLIIDKRREVVLDVVKKIDPRILTFDVLGERMIYIDIGARRLAPLNILGDGIGRVMNSTLNTVIPKSPI